MSSNDKRNRDRNFGGGQSSATLTMQKLAETGYHFDLNDERGLTVLADHTLTFRGFVFTPTHVIAPENATEEDYLDVFGLLKPIISASSFWIGDSINAAEAEHGEKYTDASRITGLTEKTLRNYAYVCRNVHMSRRKDKLTFKHHAHVADLNAELQMYWLDRAVEEHLSAAKLKKLIEGREDIDWRAMLHKDIRELDIDVKLLLSVFAAGEPISMDWVDRIEELVKTMRREIVVANERRERGEESENQDASN